jgi:ketosteroid isomerase-like protein
LYPRLKEEAAMNNAEIAKALFAAFENGDADGVRGLCAADLRARQNGGPPMDLEALLAFSASVHRVVDGFHYADAVRSETATGFVEEHQVRGTLPDGSDLDLAVCVVADVRNGKVSDLREYLDTAAVAGLMQELS